MGHQNPNDMVFTMSGLYIPIEYKNAMEAYKKRALRRRTCGISPANRPLISCGMDDRIIDFSYILGLKNLIELIVSSFQGAVFVLDDNKVAVLLEDLMSKFQTFGEGLELLNEKVDRGFTELREEMNARFEQNRQKHQQLMQMVKQSTSRNQAG